MRLLVFLSLLVGTCHVVQAQVPAPKPAQTNQNFPISTQALLKGVNNPESKSVIKSVLMIVCPKDAGKGTGFALAGGGIITTNSHVVGSCQAEELIGVSAVSMEPVKFTEA